MLSFVFQNKIMKNDPIAKYVFSVLTSIIYQIPITNIIHLTSSVRTNTDFSINHQYRYSILIDQYLHYTINNIVST